MNIELKPCPFCGGEAEMMDDQYPYAECQECAAGFTANHSYEFDEDDAASKWNARSNAGPKLKPIAEKKVRQLGGDVCGVLVRKDGRLAAVDEHGRVRWLQDDGGEYAAYLEGMNSHLKAELEAARAQGACEWAEQLDACEFHGNDHEVCAEYSGQVPCARAQSGQGAEVDEVYLPFGAASAYADAKGAGKDNMTISCELVVELIDEIYRLNAHPRPAQQGSVPEGWKLVPIEPDEHMLNAGMRAFCEGGKAFQAMVDAAPQPEGGEWVNLVEDLANRAESENISVEVVFDDGYTREGFDTDISEHVANWLRSIKRPQPPKEGE